jgi:hypothetical protein
MPSTDFSRLSSFVINVCCGRGERMSPGPKASRNGQRIDLPLCPPGTLIALPVQFTVVQSTDRDGEPVADFPPHRPLFGKLDVVRIRWGSAADKTGLRGHELQMLAVALAHGLVDDVDRLFASIDFE